MIRKPLFLLAFCLSYTTISNASDPDSWPQGYYEAKLTDTVPVINGIGDDPCWTSAAWAPIDQVWIGPGYSATDYSGRFKVLWTPERIYLLIEITDDSLRLQAPDVASVCDNIYNYDCIEIFIDENHSREVNYSNSHKAFAYHLDTTGNVCYANGSSGWERLDDNITYKMKRVAARTFNYEYEIKVFDDSFVPGGSNIPLTLTEGKLMGWSLAYNDNDMGNTRQNMTGSKFIAGNSDYERNVSYYNASVFGDLKLVKDYATAIREQTMADPFRCTVTNTGANIIVSLTNSSRENLQIQLFDRAGRECGKGNAGKSQGYFEQNMNVSGLPRGLYILRITGSKDQFEKKIVL
jgi:hypothetical protein